MPVLQTRPTYPCRSIWLLLSLFFYPIAGFGGEKPDFSYEELHEVYIHEEEGHFSLKSENMVKVHFNTREALSNHTFFIYEPSYMKVEDVKAYYKKRKLYDSEVQYHYADFSDVFISDTRIHTIDYGRRLKKDDYIRYTYTEKYSALNYYPIQAIPNIDSVSQFKFIFHRDPGIRVDFKFFFPGHQPGVKVHHARRRTILTIENLSYHKPVSYFPFNGTAGYVQVLFYKNDSLLNPLDPKQFLDWYSTLTPMIPTVDSTALSMVPDSLFSPGNDRQKIAHIYDYTKASIRYLADARRGHTITPLEPEKVLKNAYGDCKDKSALSVALAETQRLPVYMALVNSSDQAHFEGSYIDRFDHVICAWDTGDTTIFFDPTQKYQSFGQIGERLMGKQALVLNPDNPRFVTIPTVIEQPTMRIVIEAHMDSLKNVPVKVILREDYIPMVRRMYDEMSSIKRRNTLTRILNDNLYKISISDLEMVSSPPMAITLEGKADLSRFIISSSTKSYLPQSPFRYGDKNLLKRERDSLAIYFNNLIYSELDILIRGDRFVLGDTLISNAEPELSLAFETDIKNIKPDMVKVRFTFKVLQKVFSGDEKNTFLDFFKTYKKYRKKLLTLRLKEKTP